MACSAPAGGATPVPTTLVVPTSLAPATKAPPTPLPAAIVAVIETGEGPIELAATSDAIWVEIHRGGFASQIDPIRNIEAKQLLNTRVHCDIAAGAEFVWATQASGSVVTKIDPTSAEPVSETPLTDACGVAADDHDVWVVSPGLGALVRFDPTTMTERASIALAPGAFFVAIGPEAVWCVGEADGGIVWRVDTATNEVVATIPVEIPFASGIEVGFGSVWVPARDKRVIYRIDPATNAVAATIELPGAIGGIGIGADAVWASGFGNGTVYRIDPVTNSIAASLETGFGNLGPPIAVFDSVWVAALDRNAVLRLDPAAIGT
ncbi:MAG: hypothetical protein ABIZ52_00880 [Candidatus Limnocylindrales bacterium]